MSNKKRYFKDIDNDIWEWSPAIRVLYRIYEYKKREWDYSVDSKYTFDNANEDYNLKEISKDELFLEMI